MVFVIFKLFNNKGENNVYWHLINVDNAKLILFKLVIYFSFLHYHMAKHIWNLHKILQPLINFDQHTNAVFNNKWWLPFLNIQGGVSNSYCKRLRGKQVCLSMGTFQCKRPFNPLNRGVKPFFFSKGPSDTSLKEPCLPYTVLLSC